MTVPPLIVVGAGGFARETVELVAALNARAPQWDLRGIVDDSPELRGAVVAGVPVIGPVPAVHDHPDAAVVVCVGSPANFVARAQIVDRLDLDDDRYATLVHPTAVLPRAATIGRGTVVHALSVLTTDVSVGNHVAVMPQVVLTHDDVVEDFVTFGSGVRVAGTATVATGAYVGAGAVVREGLTVGAWSLVGAGSVVTRDIPAGEVWAGVPARRLRDVERTGDLAARLAR